MKKHLLEIEATYITDRGMELRTGWKEYRKAETREQAIKDLKEEYYNQYKQVKKLEVN